MNISICIPTYNRPDLLKETLDSCLAQTYPPYEIIIGDDSDTDATELMMRSSYLKKESCIRYYRHKPSLRQANNMNFLFEKAAGDKLLLIHDDDLLMPKALDTLVRISENDPSVKIAFGKSYVMDENGVIDHRASQQSNSYYYKEVKFEGAVLSSMEASIIQQFPNNGYLIDVELARSVPWRNKTQIFSLGNGCEYDFSLRIGMTDAKMYFINQYLVKYRISPISNSMSLNSDSAYKSFLLLKNAQIEPQFHKIRNIALKRKAPVAISQALNLGRPKDGLKIFFSKAHMSYFLTLGFYKRIYLFFNYIFSDRVTT